MRAMRSVVWWLAAAALSGAVGASCALRGSATEPDPETPPAPDATVATAKGSALFPNGFEQWRKLNDTIIERSDEGEARWLYVNEAATTGTGGELPTGTVMVKVQHRLFVDKAGNAQIGDVYKIATMEKTGTGSTGGWEFRAFDPETHEELGGEAEACIVCHSQRASEDYTFRALEDLRP